MLPGSGVVDLEHGRFDHMTYKDWITDTTVDNGEGSCYLTDDSFVLRPDFQHGVSLLEPAGLTYDLLLFPHHIRPAIELVDAFPKRIVTRGRTATSSPISTKCLNMQHTFPLFYGLGR